MRSDRTSPALEVEASSFSRLTDTSSRSGSADLQPVRNDNDPVNGTDPFGAACKAEPPANTGA